MNINSLNKKRKKIFNNIFYKNKFYVKKKLLFIVIFLLICQEEMINYGFINVGYYCNSLKNGGVERVMSLLINYLSKERKFNHFLITNEGKSKGDYLIDQNIKRISLWEEKLTLKEAIKKNTIDILIYNFYDQTEINELNKLKKTKIICYDHSSYFFWIYQNIFNFKDSVYNGYKNCKYVISLIPFENDYLFKKWGINSILMDNPATFEYDSVVPSDLKNKNIIMIGRAFDTFKRFDLGIIAMKSIIKEIPKCEMNILSFSVKNLEILIQNLNLEKHVRFVGFQKNLKIFLQNSSLHILPSISESYSMALSEAKIYGIPSIIIGLDYLSLAKGGTIIIYDDDPHVIAKEAIKILKNDYYRKMLGKEARKSMKNHKNSLIIQKWINLLFSIQKGNKPSFPKELEPNIISEKEAKKILNNQLNLFKRRIPLLRQITIEKLINFSII